MSCPWLRSLMPHPLLVLSSRIVQSSTWCSKMLLTSGLLVQQERSAPSSRFFITLVSATARHGNQNSSTVSPSCLGVRWSRITLLTGLCCFWLFFFLFSTQWLCHARLTAVMLCCNPVWLCMMTPSTWHTRECMHITHTIQLLNVLLKQVQWGYPAKSMNCNPRLQIDWFKAPNKT